MINKLMVFLSGAMFFLLGYQLPARADQYRSMGLANLDTGSQLDFDLHIPRHDNYVGILPELNLQFGTGDASYGLRLGYIVVIPEENVKNESSFSPLVFNLKVKKCYESESQFCFGIHFDVGIDPFNMNQDDHVYTFVHVYTHMLALSRVGGEFIGLDPMFVFELRRSNIFLQASLGPTIYVPLGDESNNDVEAGLLYELEFGTMMSELVGLGIGIRCMSPLTWDVETLFALDFNMQLTLEKIHPYLRLRVPLNDPYSEVMALAVLVGFAVPY